MQIRRLRLVNFRQHECTELELGAGLTGIIGPNGAGKTTLLEAIAWVMYGMKAARGSRETIRRRGAPVRARVEVEMDFTLGSHEYRVVRGLTSAELYQDGGPTPIANSLEAVTERVTRLLGMTRDEFFNTYFTGQKELAVMASMTAPERAQFLSRVLGYEKIRVAQERLRDARTALRARLGGLQAALPDPRELDAEEARVRTREAEAVTGEESAGAAFAGAEARLAAVRPRWEAMERTRERAQQLAGDRRVMAAELAAASEQARRLREQADESAAAARELSELTPRLGGLAPLRDELSALDRDAAAFNAQRSAVVQAAEVRERLAQLERRAVELPGADTVNAARARADAIRAELTAFALEADERRTAWVRDRQDAETRHQGLRDQFAELREQRDRIVAAGEGGACPTCARPLGAEYANVLGVLDRQLEAVLANGKYFRQRVAQLEMEPPELEAVETNRVRAEQALGEAVEEQGRLEAQAAELRALEAERRRLEARRSELEAAAGAVAIAYDPSRHDAVRREIAALEPLVLRAERLRGAAGRADTVAGELRVAVAAADTLTGRLADADAQLGALGFSDAAYDAVRAEERESERQRRAAELALERARGERQAAATAVAAVLRRREDAEARRKEAAEVAVELAMHQELDRALTDLRTELNQTLRPELSELASGFVRDLTNGRYTELELDENYMATLLDEGDPKAVISGGEEDIANLALRLAISQMIAERAGQPLALLVLDEIFGSLDEERRVAVVELLRSLADRFPQVVLITHIDSVREGFDRVVRVAFDAASGSATVRDEQPGGHDVAA